MIIVDIGFWVVLVYKNDNYYEVVKKSFVKYNEFLIIIWCVVIEICYFL